MIKACVLRSPSPPPGTRPPGAPLPPGPARILNAHDWVREEVHRTMDDEELQEQQNWDWDKVERHALVKQPRAVVSVPFSRQDFERLAAYARQQGTTVSGAIRQAA